MDSLNQQVAALNHKVDRLYEILMEVNDRVGDLIASQTSAPPQSLTSGLEPPESRAFTRQQLSLEPRLEHKDILSDDDYVTTNAKVHREEAGITADIQIQRLTAQLTAAYNRIAALEERLLSQRTPH